MKKDLLVLDPVLALGYEFLRRVVEMHVFLKYLSQETHKSKLRSSR